MWQTKLLSERNESKAYKIIILFPIKISLIVLFLIYKITRLFIYIEIKIEYLFFIWNSLI